MNPRNLFDLMPDGEGAADMGDTSGGGQPTGDAAGAAVPAPAPAAAEAAAPAATTSLDWDQITSDPEFQAREEQRFNEYMNTLAAQYEEPAYQQQQEPFSDVLEGFEALGIPPERFQEFLQAQMQPFAQFAEQMQTDKQLGAINQQLDQLTEQHPGLFGEEAGDLAGDNRYAALSLSYALQQTAAQSGQKLNSDQALRQSAEWLAARDAKVAEQAKARYVKELESLSGAPRDLTGSGVSGVTPAAPAASEMDVVRRFLERQQAA
jgi:hypothetical protein